MATSPRRRPVARHESHQRPTSHHLHFSTTSIFDAVARPSCVYRTFAQTCSSTRHGTPKAFLILLFALALASCSGPQSTGRMCALSLVQRQLLPASLSTHPASCRKRCMHEMRTRSLGIAVGAKRRGMPEPKCGRSELDGQNKCEKKRHNVVWSWMRLKPTKQDVQCWSTSSPLDIS